MVGLAPAPGSGLSTRYFWRVNHLHNRTGNESDSAMQPPADSRDRRADWGWVRHRRAASCDGDGARLARGFKLGTMFRAQSAPPYNITLGADANRDAILNDRPAGMPRNSARAARAWYLDARLSWTRGFGEKAESSPEQITRAIRFGDDSRGVPDMGFARAPGSAQPLVSLQICAQVCTVCNHANLTSFTGVVTSPYFGHATAAMPGRRMEVGMRRSF
jgi:hypothetical protein